MRESECVCECASECVSVVQHRQKLLIVVSEHQPHIHQGKHILNSDGSDYTQESNPTSSFESRPTHIHPSGPPRRSQFACIEQPILIRLQLVVLLLHLLTIIHRHSRLSRLLNTTTKQPHRWLPRFVLLLPTRFPSAPTSVRASSSSALLSKYSLHNPFRISSRQTSFSTLHAWHIRRTGNAACRGTEWRS